MCRVSHRMTWAEFEAKQKEEGRILIAITGKVYDVSKWKEHHPGGGDILEVMKGKDVTDHFYVHHSQKATEKLRAFYVADIEGYNLTPMQKDFRGMVDELRSKGLFKTDYLWYVKHTLCLVALLLSVFGGVIYSDSFLVHIVSAISLGLFWQQISFLGHDLGHDSITHSRTDRYLAILVTTFLGVSGDWWKRVHNTHHVTTNAEDHDPDIQYLPLFAVNSKACRDFFSSYHKKWFRFDAAAKFLVSIQHYLFYPVLSVARFNLYALGWIHLLTKSAKKDPTLWIERASIVVYLCWNIWLLSYLPNFLHFFFFVLISHQVCGIIHIQIVLSHFAMETYGGDVKSGKDFIPSQLESTLDVDCDPWMDWFHGGLQFQSTHHLLPHIPRHRLRYVRDNYILPFCKRHGLQYNAVTFVQCNKMVLSKMREAAHIAQKESSFFDSFLWKLLTAQG